MKKPYLLVLALAVSIIALAQNNWQISTEAKHIIVEMDAIESLLPQINVLSKKGEKSQAKELSQNALQRIQKIETKRSQLVQLGEIDENLPSLAQIQEIKVYLNNKLHQLQIVYVYFHCNAEIFGKEYTTLKDDILSELSKCDVSFVDSANLSDWSITITAKTREFNKADFGSMSSYFSYVDAKTIIEKQSTRQRIYENTISLKGGHTQNYEQAARQAYKDISPRISAIIKEQIQQ